MRGSTRARAGWDVRKMAAALAAPGIDTRYWLDYGIVATVGEDGEVDDADPDAVIQSADGREADVVLATLDHVTCRIPSGGRNATDDSPIEPGDEVLVAIPAGASGQGPVILCVMNSAADRLPAENGLPLFKNDRRLIWAGDLPIDLRNRGARLEIRPDGTIVLTGADVLLGGPDAAQQVPRGNAQMDAFNELLTSGAPSLLSAVTALVGVAVGPLGALQPGFQQALDALTKFQGSAAADGNFLSGVTKTK